MGRIGTKLLWSLLSLLFAVVAAEAAHRLWFYGPGGFSPTRLASVRDFGDTGFTRDSEHPRIEYGLEPDLSGWFKLEPFETSSDGLRDREYAREKPEGVFRIAVIGDSYTMGSGVPIDAVYHSVLEDALNERGRFECINFGVAGYSLLHYAGVIEHAALAWDPDLILIGLVSNDNVPPAMGYLHGIFPDHPELDGRPDRAVRGEAPARSFWRATVLDRIATPEEQDRPERPEQNGASGGGGRYKLRVKLAVEAARAGQEGVTADRYVAAALQRIRALAGDVPVFCAYLDTTTRSSEAVEAFARQVPAAGLGWLDTRDLFEGRDGADYWIFPDDGHPNAAAHALYAAALEAALREGWIPE